MQHLPLSISKPDFIERYALLQGGFLPLRAELTGCPCLVDRRLQRPKGAFHSCQFLPVELNGAGTGQRAPESKASMITDSRGAFQ